MATREAVFPEVGSARFLTALEHHKHCPDKPGIYAAWIRDRAGLITAGIDGPLPRLIYVGISIRERGGLRARLGQHVDIAFQPMNELLAARGVVIGGWGYRLLPAHTGRMAPLTPLLELAWQQTLAWQHEHFRWAWQPCKPAIARVSELEAIREQTPLLNLRHTTDGLPPQLRAGRRYERARARWLWHISWAALLFGNPRRLRDPFDLSRWVDDSRHGTVRVAVDELGFPMPLKQAGSVRALRTVRIPGVEEIWDMMAAAAERAPAAIRHAIGQGCDDAELDVWWAVHAGAPYLPKPVPVRSAIRQSLRLASDKEAACPVRLPIKDRVHELSNMLGMLDGVGH